MFQDLTPNDSVNEVGFGKISCTRSSRMSMHETENRILYTAVKMAALRAVEFMLDEKCRLEKNTVGIKPGEEGIAVVDRSC